MVMITKEECLKAVEKLKLNGRIAATSIRNSSLIEQLIEEHFDNPPLKFEELKRGMWVWDNLFKRYNKIVETSVHMFETTYLITFEYVHEPTRWKTIKFEENRFYRKQVEE